jgi:hypothetical protein
VSGSIDGITLNAFTQFTEDVRIVGGGYRRSHLDTLFMEVNATSRRMGAAAKAEAARAPAARAPKPSSSSASDSDAPGVTMATIKAEAEFGSFHKHGAQMNRRALALGGASYDSASGLSRIEFMVVLTRIAVSKYIVLGELTDVSITLSTIPFPT